MQISAAPMENRENMLMKMIRRSNTAILNFVKGIRLRSAGATLLGALAGLSLTSNIIPSAMEFTGIMDSFSARWALGSYPVYAMILWGIGGRAAQKTGSKKLGAIILGLVGLTSGLLFTAAGIGTGVNVLLTGCGAATLYGAMGGFIIGDALREPAQIESIEAKNAEGSRNNRGSDKSGRSKTKNRHPVRVFRFFKKR